MIAEKISTFNRNRKFNFFMSYFKPTVDMRVLDVGASEKEYQEAANLLEKRYPYSENITVLSVDNFETFHSRHPKVKVMQYRGGTFPFKEKEFDICWSNAVMEHVGDRRAIVLFLKEIARVARHAFITTPNRYFPFEVHTKVFLIHWLPKAIFDKILKAANKNWAAGKYMHLMRKKEIEGLLKEAGIEKYIIMKNKILGFTMDFSIIF